jgi:hypothetical protein
MISLLVIGRNPALMRAISSLSRSRSTLLFGITQPLFLLLSAAARHNFPTPLFHLYPLHLAVPFRWQQLFVLLVVLILWRNQIIGWLTGYTCSDFRLKKLLNQLLRMENSYWSASIWSLNWIISFFLCINNQEILTWHVTGNRVPYSWTTKCARFKSDDLLYTCFPRFWT